MFEELTLSNTRKVVYQRLGGSSGLVAPIVAFVCISVAIVSYPQFSWTNNALSDLGVVSGFTESAFNFGLLAAGLLAFNFAIFGLYSYLGKSWVGKTGSAVFAGSSLALIAISVFTEDYSPLHYIVSVLFFVLVPISLFLISGAFLLNHQSKLSVFTVGVGFAAALPWLLQFVFNYVPNVAIPETASGLAVSLWAIVVGKKMLKP
jgi:hypothetical membrane protein